MAKPVPHQITLIAFTRNENGTMSVYDIIETSFHHASYFARRYMRNPDVCAFQARAPGARYPGREWKR